MYISHIYIQQFGRINNASFFLDPHINIFVSTDPAAACDVVSAVIALSQEFLERHQQLVAALSFNREDQMTYGELQTAYGRVTMREDMEDHTSTTFMLAQQDEYNLCLSSLFPTRQVILTTQSLSAIAGLPAKCVHYLYPHQTLTYQRRSDEHYH
jgi:hypothetical protein